MKSQADNEPLLSRSEIQTGIKLVELCSMLTMPCPCQEIWVVGENNSVADEDFSMSRFKRRIYRQGLTSTVKDKVKPARSHSCDAGLWFCQLINLMHDSTLPSINLGIEFASLRRMPYEIRHQIACFLEDAKVSLARLTRVSSFFSTLVRLIMLKILVLIFRQRSRF